MLREAVQKITEIHGDECKYTNIRRVDFRDYR